MHLYLIRHGQSFINLPDFDWTKDNVDAPLTDLGQRQAAAVAAWCQTHIPTPDALYASTMARAQETAAFVSSAYANLPVRPDDRVREIGNNRFDHTPYPLNEPDMQFNNYWPSERPFAPTVRAGAAETMMHFQTRIGIFLEDLLEIHRDHTVIVVSHGGVMESILDLVFNVGPYRRCEVWTYNTGVTHLQYVAHPNREVWRLRLHSSIEHLTPDLRS